MKRVAILPSVVAILSLAFAAPVLAVAPGNDAYAGREVIGSIPFSATVDTTTATTDGDDAEANAFCGAPFTDASVWYEFAAPADGLFLVDASTSDYAAGVIVVSGSPGSFVLETCGAFSVAFYGASGVTYAILAFDFDGVGNGGALEITVEAAPPPPEVHFTVNSTGSFDARTGVATIRGTVTCTGARESDKAGIDVQLSQSVGRFKFEGFGGSQFVCDGTTQPWAVEVTSSAGKFAGGKASVIAHALACNFSACSEDFAERTVTLKK